MTDLEQLSRDAAGCLHADDTPLVLFGTPDVGRMYVRGGPSQWLHESTEACSEILVRVLWPANIHVWSFGFTAPDTTDGRGSETTYVEEADPMLAFRVAVLRALVAMKGKQT